MSLKLFNVATSKAKLMVYLDKHPPQKLVKTTDVALGSQEGDRYGDTLATKTINF